jgi:arsenate reductase-like glutaredoxin family protein
MTDEKPSEEEIKALQADVEAYMEKPVRENERRVRIGGTFEDNVKKMANAPPISNEELKKWAKNQREDVEE